MSKNKLMSLMDKVKEITQSGLPFMAGREKGELEGLNGSTIHITEYGYMKEDGKEYVAFICKEHENLFFFGGLVLTDSMKKLDEMLTDKELEELMENGLPVGLERIKSKNKREYTKCTFFPDGE